MVEERKKALKQLQNRLLELIFDVEELEVAIVDSNIIVSTDDFEFELKYSKKMKRLLKLIKSEPEL